LPGSGPLTAVALWAALNSLSSPGSAAYFHNYQYDPGYVQWRREADREAGHNPPVAAKLDQLDAQLAQMEDQPRNPSAPAPVRPSRAPGGSGFIWPVLFIGIVILLLLWLWRRRMALPVVARAVPGLAGSAATRFRVGMTMPVDPSPFVLAAGSTKVQPPEGSGMVSVEVVGDSLGRLTGRRDHRCRDLASGEFDSEHHMEDEFGFPQDDGWSCATSAILSPPPRSCISGAPQSVSA
jgi:hypothetical protein